MEQTTSNNPVIGHSTEFQEPTNVINVIMKRNNEIIMNVIMKSSLNYITP